MTVHEVTRRRVLGLAAAGLVGVAGAAAGGVPVAAASAEPAVGPVPATVRSRYGLDTRHYRKYLDAWGVPILGSALLTDAALQKARRRLGTLLWTRPYWPVPELARRRVRVVIVARGERMSSIPEVSAQYGTGLDDRYWGGFGATDALPVTAGTERNLLDGEGGEDVFVHEFAHTLGDMSLRFVDRAFTPELEAAWAATRSAGRWLNTYAGSSISEYLAEGVQTYFDVNAVGPAGGDGVHNAIATRTRLRTYDPPLFRLLDRVWAGARLS